MCFTYSGKKINWSKKSSDSVNNKGMQYIFRFNKDIRCTLSLEIRLYPLDSMDTHF